MFLKEGELLAESYFTVKNFGNAEIVEKKSRFIATVRPVSSETEAVAFINEIKQKYWDARHNVYAYILRENNIQIQLPSVSKFSSSLVALLILIIGIVMVFLYRDELGINALLVHHINKGE